MGLGHLLVWTLVHADSHSKQVSGSLIKYIKKLTFERNICVIVCLITVSVANNFAVKSLCKLSFKSLYGSNTDFIAIIKLIY